MFLTVFSFNVSLVSLSLENSPSLSLSFFMAVVLQEVSDSRFVWLFPHIRFNLTFDFDYFFMTGFSLHIFVGNTTSEIFNTLRNPIISRTDV